MGCSPGLGFVYVGHENSFTYDIADLYKADITIPLAFQVAATEPSDYGAVMRRKTRDAMVEHHILEHMVHDIRQLLLGEDRSDDGDVVYLWNDADVLAQSGISYGKALES